MKSTASTFTTALVLALASACGGGSNNTTSDAGTDGGAGNDGGNGNDSGTDGGTVTSKPYFGTVSFSESKANNTSSYSASAAFYATPDGGTGTPGCTGTQSGSCCYVPPSQADGGAGPALTAASAGGITLKDGATTLATMTPAGTTYAPVSSVTTSTLTWNAGDALQVSAAGDTVHAFSGTVTAAALLANVNPALSLLVPISITRASDFTITWTAATGSISLLLSATKVAANDGTITCTSASDTGTITIPTALLMNFSATDTGVLVLTRMSSADASPDNALVTLQSSTSASGTASFK